MDWEADVVNAFRADPKLKEIIGERDAPLGRSLYLAHPIQITDAGCLACHTTPDQTPASVVKAYGTGGGFGWKLNEIIGAQIVSGADGRSDRHGEHRVPDASRLLVAVFASCSSS